MGRRVAAERRGRKKQHRQARQRADYAAFGVGRASRIVGRAPQPDRQADSELRVGKAVSVNIGYVPLDVDMEYGISG